jgi:hypothetical protein
MTSRPPRTKAEGLRQLQQTGHKPVLVGTAKAAALCDMSVGRFRKPVKAGILKPVNDPSSSHPKFSQRAIEAWANGDLDAAKELAENDPVMAAIEKYYAKAS